MRQRPIKGNGYEGSSVAAGILGIDEVRHPQDRGLPGGFVCGNGIRAHGGSLRSGSRDRPGHRSTIKSRLHRDVRKPRAKLLDPDSTTELRQRRPWSTLRQWSSSTIRDMNQIRGRNLMSPRHRELHTTISHPGGDVARLALNPPQHHTHVQHSC